MAKNDTTSQKPLEKRQKTQPDFAAWAQSLLQANQEEAASKQTSLKGCLSVVSTPIGNLGDISLRALWVLSQVDAILCEDTRVSGSLLRAYGIKKPLISCHDHNETARIKEVLSKLNKGEALALISDAGTPLISDPGFSLVRACRQEGYPVQVIPGASAVLSALAGSGLATDRFLFIGFLPSKTTARQKELSSLSTCQATYVFYESPQRLLPCLKDMAQIFGGESHAVIARELTKLYEETRTGSLTELIESYEDAPLPKGECVILLCPTKDCRDPAADLDEKLSVALKAMSLRDAVAHVAQETGLKKSIVYARALTISADI